MRRVHSRRPWLLHELVEVDAGERQRRVVELAQDVQMRIQLEAAQILQLGSAAQYQRGLEAVHFIGCQRAVLLHRTVKQQFAVYVRVVDPINFDDAEKCLDGKILVT